MGRGVKTADDLLEENDARLQKSYTPIILFLAADRVDIQHSLSMLMPGIANPRVLYDLRFKRIGTSLHKYPEMEWMYAYSSEKDTSSSR